MLQISLFNLILILIIIILTVWYIIIRVKKIQKNNNEFTQIENKIDIELNEVVYKINETMIISKYINYRINHFGLIENGINSEKLNIRKYFTQDEINILIIHGYINLTLK